MCYPPWICPSPPQFICSWEKKQELRFNVCKCKVMAGKKQSPDLNISANTYRIMRMRHSEEERDLGSLGGVW